MSNFTQSLAAHLARDFNPKLRVNAVAPGFFPNNNPAQMLFNPDGSYRAKAQRGVDATPMHRMGHPNELIGTLVWLASDASLVCDGHHRDRRRGGISSVPRPDGRGPALPHGGQTLGKERERFRTTFPLYARGAVGKGFRQRRFFGSGKKALEGGKRFRRIFSIVALPESL